MPSDCGYCGDDCESCCTDCCEDSGGESGGNHHRKIYRDKSPKNANRHIGVEIEFISPKQQHVIAEILEGAGLDDICCLKDDGSVEADDKYGHELTILTTERTYQADLKKICRVLNSECAADINASCGLHVHLDMRGRVKERAYENLVRAQDILFQMQPLSRRTNTFCKPSPRNFQYTVDNRERYLAINPCAYRRHKTIEVRLHSGTTNAIKITNWVELLLKIVNKRKELAFDLTDLKLFNKEIKVRNKIKRYMIERIRSFATRAVPTPIGDDNMNAPN